MLHRQLVKELPKKAAWVRPTDWEPAGWHLSSDLARIIGEAKSLPGDRFIKLDGSVLDEAGVAWFAARVGVVLYTAYGNYYLRREVKHDR